MSDLTKAGPSVLEMDDIMEYIDVIGGFVKNTQLEKAHEDKKIKAIAGVPSDHVAQCVEPSDRTTVRNALNLAGLPATDYMTTVSGAKLSGNIQSVSETNISEISELRDEVYQLRMELAKSGVTLGYAPYSGFYDMFRVNSPMHQNKPITHAVENSTNPYEIIVEDKAFDKFFVNDKVLLKSKESGMTQDATVVEKDIDGRTLKLDTEIGFEIKKDKCDVYKTKGNILSNTFTFGEVEEEAPSQKEIFTGLDDDTFKKRLRITEKNTGYGYTFRVPEKHQKNYLSKLGIRVKRHGDPGALMCYIIDERDIPRWKNAEQAIADNDSSLNSEGELNNELYDMTKYNFFAKSQPLTVDKDKGEYIAQFSFYDPYAGSLEARRIEDLTPAEIVSLTDDEREALKTRGVVMMANANSYPRLTNVDTDSHRARYCMIIEALEGTDLDNYYEIVFLQNENDKGKLGDLQLNNITYKYKEVGSDTDDKGLVTDDNINAQDLYYDLTLLEAKSEVFIPYNDGFYSAHFVLDDPIAISKARLALRIAREGVYTIDTAGMKSIGDLYDGCNIKVTGPEDGFYSAEQIAVGTDIRKITQVNNRSLNLAKGLHVDADDIVYPIKYKAHVNAKLTRWDPKICKTVTEEAVQFDLPLFRIMHDQHRRNGQISDRIIFENSFVEENWEVPHKFNDIEIQITWEKSCKEMSEQFTGRIYDLVLSLDRDPMAIFVDQYKPAEETKEEPKEEEPFEDDYGDDESSWD